MARKHEINKQSLILMRAKVLFSHLEMLAPEKKVKIQIISSKRTQENEFVSYKLTEKVSSILSWGTGNGGLKWVPFSFLVEACLNIIILTRDEYEET